MLTIYDSATGNFKNYVPARDRCLRESSSPDSRCLPPFRHGSKDREEAARLNVFFVALNAEMKFSRYFRMIRSHPPRVPLPDRVRDLMKRTIKLVELIYWTPEPAKASQGEEVPSGAPEKRRNPGRAARSDGTKTVKRKHEETQDPSTSYAISSRRRKLTEPADVDLETCTAYGRAVVYGHSALLSFHLHRSCMLKLYLPRSRVRSGLVRRHNPHS